MKVLHVEAGRHLYGGALQVYYLLRELAGYESVENVLVCPAQSEIATKAQDFATVEACTMRGDLDLPFYFRLQKLLRHHQADILHIHSRRGADFWGALVARRSGVPSVLTRRVDNREAPWFARWKARSYEKVVAISDGIRAVLLAEGLPGDQVLTIHSAVDTEVFRPAENQSPNRARGALRQRFGFSVHHQLVAVVAQLIERKGHRFLFEIAPQLIRQFPQVRFLILGQGPERTTLEQQVNHLGLQSVVHFAGFQRDIEQVLPLVDVVVHPALKEGLGVALLQASACGVPVIAGAAGGIPEIVRDGKNGFLVPPADSQALLEKIILLLGDASLRSEFGSCGRRIVEQEFAINVMAERNLALYRQILRQGA